MTGVYFIRCNEYIKIGYATNIYQRLTSMQVGNPYDLTLLAVCRCKSKDEAREAEDFWHEVFAKYHYKAEWYHASGIERYIFKNHKRIGQLVRRHKLYQRGYKPIEAFVA